MPPKYYKSKGKNTNSSISANPNAKYLIIVESPSKCRKIEEYLGEDYQCIASKGHIREIDGLKSIDTKKTFTITFSLIEEKKQHVESMRSVISHYPKQSIFLASDDDREGEAISWHICQVFGLPIETTKRILFHEITQPALLKAVQNPTHINMSLVYAQHARQILDLIVGYKISPVLWKHIHNNKKNGLSAGRCQTPALRLVYENEKEDSSSKKMEMKWKTSAIFFSTATKFDLSRDFTLESQVIEFLEKSKTHSYSMTVSEAKESLRTAPRPFNTSTLLQTTSNLLHYSPKTTMDLCQQLYQMGHITYMRTDSQKYSAVFLVKARDYITRQYGAQYVTNNINAIENRDNGNPHEAIRVTNLDVRCIDCGDNRILQSMYRLIWKNTVESCMESAKYNCYSVRISAPSIIHGGGDIILNNSEKKLDQYYENVIEIPVFLGWKKVFIGNGEDDGGENNKTAIEEKTKASTLLMFIQSIIKKGEPFQHTTVECNVVAQSRHSRYTEASLINKLEELGIGRPSTFATIVDTIQERGYVKKMDVEGEKIKCVDYKLRGITQLEKVEKEKIFGAEKNKLVIMPTGVVVLEFLVEHFSSVFTYEYTSVMEKELDIISCEDIKEKAEQDGVDLCRKCLKEIKQLVKPTEKMEKQKYPLEDGYELVFHQYGASLKRIDPETEEAEYKPVKKGIKIDIEKLKNGEYKVSDLLEIQGDGLLGEYEGKKVYLKRGKYGLYVHWIGEDEEKKISLKGISTEKETILLEDVIPYIKLKLMEDKICGVGDGEEMISLDIDLSKIGDSYKGSGKPGGVSGDTQGVGILRVLSANTSIRNGKFGPYIYYKTNYNEKSNKTYRSRFNKIG